MEEAEEWIVASLDVRIWVGEGRSAGTDLVTRSPLWVRSVEAIVMYAGMSDDAVARNGKRSKRKRDTCIEMI